MGETPGQRSASSVLDLIDGALLGDSPDAMRWSPEPADRPPGATIRIESATSVRWVSAIADPEAPTLAELMGPGSVDLGDYMTGEVEVTVERRPGYEPHFTIIDETHTWPVTSWMMPIIDAEVDRLEVQMRQGTYLTGDARRYFNETIPARATLCWKHRKAAGRAWRELRAR